MAAESLAFPALPAQSYQGAPIYFEPMMGSGELLTVLVALVGGSGSRVVQAIRPTAIRAMYGAKAQNFSNLVSLIQESLSDHLEKWRSFEGWRAPLSGARLGEVRSLLADDPAGALRQLILLHASLSAVDEPDEDESENGNDNDPVSRHWWKEVKSAVSAKSPLLASSFGVRLSGRVAGYRFKLGFLDRGVAAHFGLARPDKLGADGRDLKAKLWELQSVKGLLEVREASLVLCAPTPSPLFGPKQLASAQTLVREIQAEAAERELVLYSVSTTDEAAEVLLSRLAA